MDQDKAEEDVAKLADEMSANAAAVSGAAGQTLRSARSNLMLKSRLTLAQVQASVARGMYVALGLSVIGVAIFTAVSMWDFLQVSTLPSVLLVISICVGLLTILYGILKARLILDAERHQVKFDFLHEDEPSDPDFMDTPFRAKALHGRVLRRSGRLLFVQDPGERATSVSGTVRDR